MVIMRAVALSLREVQALLVLAALAVSLGAQDPAPTEPAKPAAPQLARVTLERVALRCWPTAVEAPPVFEDSLQKDDVVAIGQQKDNFREVLLAVGPVGYVSKKFTKADEQGQVVTVGNDVSFRFRPRSSEAPVDFLVDGTVLQVVGEDADWWRVRCKGSLAWVLETDLAVVEANEASLLAQASTERRFASEVETFRANLLAKQRKLAQDNVDLGAVAVIERSFVSEASKPGAEQGYAPLLEALAKLDASLAADSAGKLATEALRKRMETQQWIAEAMRVQLEKPKPATDVQPVVQPKDELERFQAIGWLRYQSRFNLPGTYYLEKGGKRLHDVTCASGRYDLALYLDCEVGLAGPMRRSKDDATAANLDAERIEVLSLRSK